MAISGKWNWAIGRRERKLKKTKREEYLEQSMKDTLLCHFKYSISSFLI
jgi:hypothetical protein